MPVVAFTVCFTVSSITSPTRLSIFIYAYIAATYVYKTPTDAVSPAVVVVSVPVVAKRANNYPSYINTYAPMSIQLAVSYPPTLLNSVCMSVIVFAFVYILSLSPSMTVSTTSILSFVSLTSVLFDFRRSKLINPARISLSNA